MSTTPNPPLAPSDRRQYERVNLTYPAQVFVNENRQQVGIVRQLGQGGILVETDKKFEKDLQYELEMLDSSEKIHVTLQVICRSSQLPYSSFEFNGLNVASAEGIGILLGKYYPEKSQ